LTQVTTTSCGRQQMRLREKCRRLPRRRDLLPVPYV